MIINPTYAAYTIEDPSGFAATTTVGGIITSVIPAILFGSGMIVFVLLLYGGFTYMVSGGKEEEVTKASKTITYAIVGATVIVAAYALSRVIGNVLEIPIVEEPVAVEPE